MHSCTKFGEDSLGRFGEIMSKELQTDTKYCHTKHYIAMVAKHGQSGGNKCKPFFSYSNMSIEQKKHGLQESI